jgi:type IV pilus assembly protein PilA
MSKSMTKIYQANLSLLSWLVRIFLYSSVFASVFLPSYVVIKRDLCGGNKHIVPSILSQAHCRLVEPRNNTGALNRAQQAYYLEHNRLADSIKDLGLGIQTEYGDYSYRIVQPMVPIQDLDRSVSPESNLPMRMTIAQYKIKDDGQNCYSLKNYLGVVWNEGSGTEALTLAILCEMTNPLPTTMPNLEDGEQCPSGSRTLGE